MLVAGCATSGHQQAARSSDLTIGEQATVALFQRLLVGRTGPSSRLRAACLGEGRPTRDVSPQVLAGVVSSLKVRPHSACSLAPSDERVVDTVTGEEAVQLTISNMRCEALRCTASGNVFFNPEHGQSSDYVLERRAGTWIVVTENLRSVA
jgi:hypothetical protein